MMCSASSVRSRIDMTCPSAGQPEAFLNVELVMPSCWARWVMRRANPASVPSGDSASASTAQASLPESTMMPRSRSSTRTRSLVFRNMVEPVYDIACSETGSRSSSERRPSRIASKVMYSVISFDMDAGGTASSAFFASRTVPVVTSITCAAVAFVSKAAACVARRMAVPAARRRRVVCRMGASE